ncbi:MAG: hypothetical protein A3C35_02170 [Omnitrophica bacterium RIFCSPHIGHO2_02_FULL_46_11]|nr:MAG: hypothetical protein A3A81_07135 [Omnitrophica bacterium RIFCSPLOWO2_01_FULL_45_10b]OGW86411.1 MAG: hypothetical protein A3C35_02170 [Omnitrophica bacterium RIFCSPHIGHO2_02_FULL_46_11]
MKKQCPFCNEDVKFDPKSSENGPKKCPHCHEFIPSSDSIGLVGDWIKNVFSGKIIKKENDNIDYKKVVNLVLSFLFSALIALGIWFITGLPEKFNIPYTVILGCIAFIIALVALTRPFNIQTVVIIGFIALMFSGLGTLWQKENFDLRNRPYIGIVPQYFDMTQDYVLPSGGATLNTKATSNDKIFRLNVWIENSGEIGAILQDFEYIPFVTRDGSLFLDSGSEQIDAIPLKKLNEHYGVIEWKNAPVLPHNTIEQKIVNNPFGISDFQRLGGDNMDVYFWLKATYRPIGEKKKFYFWTIVRSKGNSEFQFLNSGDDNRDFPKQYKIY